ncbi:MAG: 4a-hydroxytetrahydrobiopterin dehydratase [Gammaproteobacteria bacterium]|nr:4a-hydroxytetrahydrobiopterin dehydratase [Gammaproteobacteria bacterium]
MLSEQHCAAIDKDTPVLERDKTDELISQLNSDWSVRDGKFLYRAFDFKNFHETMAFVNAVAWIAHQEDHHPDMEVSYKQCVLNYTSHVAGGLTENDFICAAHVDRLLAR